MGTKRLVDLYVLGKEVRFEVENEPDIVVWMKKLQPFEQETCMHRANMKSARILTLKKLDPNHDEVLVIEHNLEDNFKEDDLISFVAAGEIQKAYRSVEARISDEEEWTEGNYLEALQDSWADLEDYFHQDEFPEQHAEALRVFNELKRFSDAVDAEFEKQKARLIREFSQKTPEDLTRLGVEKLIEMKADMAWLEEFKKSQIWLSTREDKDHKVRYFESRDEIDVLHPTILNKLQTAYDAISVSPEEGKD